MNKNGQLLRLLLKCLVESDLRLVNMLRIMFLIIPKLEPAHAKVYALKRKQLQKVNFFMILGQAIK